MSVASIFVEGAGCDGGIASSDIIIGGDLLGGVVGGGNPGDVGADVNGGLDGNPGDGVLSGGKY